MFERHFVFGTHGVFADSPKQIPLCFQTDVPEGNYRLTVMVEAEENISELLIFAGRRHLVYKGSLAAGESLCQEIVMNVCHFLPRPCDTGAFRTGADIRIVGSHIRLTELHLWKVQLPTIYIGGDSTVASQGEGSPYDPAKIYCGWGQMLGAYLNNTVAVCNQAHCGLNTETFRNEGHYAIVEQNIRFGDYFFLQFGHNDQKLEHLQAWTGYRANLVRYIQETLDKGSHPILVTPLARNTWRRGEYVDWWETKRLEDNAEVCRELGHVYSIPVLDLHKLSMAWIKSVGEEAASAYRYPGDTTHPNDYGAYLDAGFLRNELSRTCSGLPVYQLLADSVTNGFGPWNPEKGQQNETPL